MEELSESRVVMGVHGTLRLMGMLLTDLYLVNASSYLEVKKMAQTVLVLTLIACVAQPEHHFTIFCKLAAHCLLLALLVCLLKHFVSKHNFLAYYAVASLSSIGVQLVKMDMIIFPYDGFLSLCEIWSQVLLIATCVFLCLSFHLEDMLEALHPTDQPVSRTEVSATENSA